MSAIIKDGNAGYKEHQMDIFVQLIISGLVNGAIYGLIAIGFVLIYKCSAVLNFAQGNMVLIGAYIFWFFKGPMGFGLFPALLFCIFFSFLLKKSYN